MRPTRQECGGSNTSWQWGTLRWCARIISVLSLFGARSRLPLPDEGRRALGGEDVQGFGRLAQHGPTHGPLVPLPFGGRHQPWHLTDNLRGRLSEQSPWRG